MLTILAIIPFIWLLVSLGQLRIASHRACPVALLLVLAIAVFGFEMPVTLIAQASWEGFLLALFPILWVIVTALFLYNVTVVTHQLEVIKQMLISVSPDRRVQGLLLAFAFGGFLEAVAGFGTAVAIPVGILVAIGFQPLLAVTICLIANTVPVAFGVLGIPILTLAQVTGLPLNAVALNSAMQLLPFAVLLPIVIVFMVTKSFQQLHGVLMLSLASGIAFAAGQTITVLFIGPDIAAVVGSLVSLLLIVAWTKLRPVKKVWRFPGEPPGITAPQTSITCSKAIIAWSPYIIICLLVGLTRFLAALPMLQEYPFVIARQFYFGPGGKPVVFQLATNPGTILLVAAVWGGLLQKASFLLLFQTFSKTFRQVVKTGITICSIVILAKVMGYSGMINQITVALVVISGSKYPLIAPLVGAWGTFLTGSDTSSNILFGNLQKQTALQLQIDPEWLTAANASGATAGKMISPQSIAIASAATDLAGSEEKILATTVKWCLVYVLLMGVLVFFYK